MMLIFRMAQTYFVVDPPCGRFLSLRGKTSRSEIHEPLYIYQPQKWAEVAGIYHRDVKLENLMFRGRTSGPRAGRQVGGRHYVSACDIEVFVNGCSTANVS